MKGGVFGLSDLCTERIERTGQMALVGFRDFSSNFWGPVSLCNRGRSSAQHWLLCRAWSLDCPRLLGTVQGSQQR